MADLRTQSPLLAITLGEIIGANDPKATATKGHAKSVASFQSFGRARYGCLTEHYRTNFYRADAGVPIKRNGERLSGKLMLRNLWQHFPASM
ncbi:MAG TPA: hypothetical protein VN957_28340 [Chthoniobacterales bacterium]|nr:hypothetical protein [Chthoniobacterales bacterium]